MLKPYYIYHSCFLIETTACYLLFDYFKGALPSLDKKKPLLLFSSHRHHDHFSSQVFHRFEEQSYPLENVFVVLSHDIYTSRIPSGIDFLHVTGGRDYDLPYDMKLRTLTSTDEGVAFLVFTKEGTLYHGGDLNDWTWEGESEEYNRSMTARYEKEILTLSNIPIDLAMIPLDPRQEKDYARGILFFLKKVDCKQILPMHYWEQPSIIETFQKEYPEYAQKILYTESYTHL